jgi:hypothetical protein
LKRGTLAAAREVESIESEHFDYDVSTKGFIGDIQEVEKKNEERIESKELEDEHIYWLEEKLAPIIEEFSGRTKVIIPEGEKQGEEDDDENTNAEVDSDNDD